MRIKFDVTGDFKHILNFLDRSKSSDSITNTLEQIGVEGVTALSQNTPKDSGATASAWSYEVEKSRGSTFVSWNNTAHPQVSGNLARMLDTGYMTGTGGYVPPRNYIKPAMSPVYKRLDSLMEAITDG